MPSGFFTYEVLEELEEIDGDRPITIYGTSVATATFQGEQYRQHQNVQRRQRALRQHLLTSSSNFVG
jgi:hypothetical protein